MAEPPDFSITALDAEIAQLRTQLAALVDVPGALLPLQALLAEKERQRAALLSQTPQSAPFAPVISSSVTAGRDVVVGTNVQVNNGLPDATAVRRQWLERLIEQVAASVASAALPLPSDDAVMAAISTIPQLAADSAQSLRRQLAIGLAALPGDQAPPAALGVSLAGCLIANLLTPLVDMPAIALPASWPRALALLADQAVADLVRDIHMRFVPSSASQRDALRKTFEQTLQEPQYAPGLHRLLRYLAADERRDALLAEGAVAAKTWRSLSGQPPDERLKYLLTGVAGGIGVGVAAAVMSGSAQAAPSSNTPPSQLAPTQTPSSPTPAAPARPDTAWTIPVMPEEWRFELARRNEHFGAPAGYWCYVPGGTYTIGGWEPGDPSARITLVPFWISRVPITVAQCAPFVTEGYNEGARRWWTPNGLRWKVDNQRTQPHYWNEPKFNAPRQPVIGVTWYEAMACATWLNNLPGLELPPGYELRLPTEAEWEAAAYDARGERHEYPWGAQPPTAERAVYGQEWDDGPPLVGSRPFGAAASGALDLVGTVWECAASVWDDYPHKSDWGRKDFTTNEYDVVWRGGSYGSSETYVRCGGGGGGSATTQMSGSVTSVFEWWQPLGSHIRPDFQLLCVRYFRGIEHAWGGLDWHSLSSESRF